MYRFLLFSLVLIIGCQQEIPSTAEALTDAEVAQIKEQVLERMQIAEQARLEGDFDNEHASLTTERDDGFVVYNYQVFSNEEWYEQLKGMWSEENPNRVTSQSVKRKETKIAVLSPTVAVMSLTADLGMHYLNGEGSDLITAQTIVWIKEADGWNMHSLQMEFKEPEDMASNQ